VLERFSNRANNLRKAYLALTEGQSLKGAEGITRETTALVRRGHCSLTRRRGPRQRTRLVFGARTHTIARRAHSRHKNSAHTAAFRATCSA
jgi:hypothetical protein